MTNELGLFAANSSTLATAEYVYARLNEYRLSHVFVMRQMADLSATPLAALAGDAVIAHFRAIYSGTMILNVGIDPTHARELAEQDDCVLIAFGREYIANPDLMERIRVGAVLNDQRSAGYYGSSPEGYTDYPFLPEEKPTGISESDEAVLH
jgi:N-ethylmaleimide reductase